MSNTKSSDNPSDLSPSLRKEEDPVQPPIHGTSDIKFPIQISYINNAPRQNVPSSMIEHNPDNNLVTVETIASMKNATDDNKEDCNKMVKLSRKKRNQRNAGHRKRIVTMRQAGKWNRTIEYLTSPLITGDQESLSSLTLSHSI